MKIQIGNFITVTTDEGIKINCAKVVDIFLDLVFIYHEDKVLKCKICDIECIA